MRITLGQHFFDAKLGKDIPVAWDTDHLINAHILVLGASGVGKTHTIRKMIRRGLAHSERPVRFHVFDVHGDIAIPGASEVQFSEAAPYGLNPLRVNPDPHSHRKREYPTVRDVLEYAERVHLERFLGTDQKAIFALKSLNRTAKEYQAKLRAAARLARLTNGEFDVEAREKLEAARKDACEAYERYANSVQTGHELESLIKYDSADVLKSTLNRLQNLYRTGIFKDTPPPFDPACPVWRYKINALSQEEKKLFVLFTLQEIFYRALQRGEAPDVVEVVVLDELGVYCTSADTEEGDGIIGTICREGRKFGLAFWGATQSPAAIPEGLLSATGTKMVLGLDEMFWPLAISKLRIEKNCLEWIRAQASMAVQMKVKGSLKNRWWWVNLEDDLARRTPREAVGLRAV